MIFDITSQESAFEFLCKFTNISPIIIQSFLESHTSLDFGVDTTNVTANNLLAFVGISYEQLDTANIEVVGLHYTSNNDNCKSIRTFGLGDLQFALTQKTPLKTFLCQNGIIFDLQKKEMYFNGKSFDIEFTTYELAAPLSQIAHKVYYDNQTSCFFRVKNICDYGGMVDKRPEFLLNLDKQFKQMGLSEKWKSSSKSYEIKFKATPQQFMWYTFFENEDSCDFDGHGLSRSLLTLALDVASMSDRDEIFAYLKPTEILLPQQIISITSL